MPKSKQDLPWLRKQSTKLRAEQKALSAEVVKTELNTGITFANVALSTEHTDTLERNKANARKAYDTALRYMTRLAPEDAAELEDLVKHLHRKLRDLGESL